MGHEPTQVSTVDAWAAAWSARDATRVAALCTNDCVYEDVALAAVNHGTDELVAFANGAFSAFPDFAIHVTSQFGDAEWAGAEWTMTGTHRGDLGALPATGKSFDVRGATVFQYHDGKIARCTDYWDMADLLPLGLARHPDAWRHCQVSTRRPDPSPSPASARCC